MPHRNFQSNTLDCIYLDTWTSMSVSFPDHRASNLLQSFSFSIWDTGHNWRRRRFYPWALLTNTLRSEGCRQMRMSPLPQNPLASLVPLARGFVQECHRYWYFLRLRTRHLRDLILFLRIEAVDQWKSLPWSTTLLIRCHVPGLLERTCEQIIQCSRESILFLRSLKQS